MAVRIKDFFRNLATGSGIPSRTVSLKRAVDDFEIASTTTGSDGSFTFTDSDTTYRGPVYYEVNDGTRYKKHSGKSIGQVGPLWVDDLLRTLDQLGVGIVNGMAVTGGNGNMTLTVAAGAAILKDGALYAPASSQSVTVTTAHASNPRIDSVVIRGTRRGETEEGNASLVVIAGTAASSPVAPSLTQTSATWDVWLADIQVDAAVTLIASNKVTDRRTFSAHLTPPVGSTGDVLMVAGGKWVASAPTAGFSVDNDDVLLGSNFNTIDVAGGLEAAVSSPTSEVRLYVKALGITSGMLASGAVGTAAKIADGIITFAKLAAAAVGTSSSTVAAGNHTHLLTDPTFDQSIAGYVFHSVGTSLTTITSKNTAALTSGKRYKISAWAHGQGNAPAGGSITLYVRISAGGTNTAGTSTETEDGERPLDAQDMLIVTGTGAVVNVAVRAVTSSGTGSITDAQIAFEVLPLNVPAS